MMQTISTIAVLMLAAIPRAFAQSAADVRGAAPVVPLASQPPAKLIVDPPLAEPSLMVALLSSIGRRTYISCRCMDPRRSPSHPASAISTLQSTIFPGAGSTPAGNP